MINENYRTKKTSIFIQKKLTEICSFKINAYLCTRFQEQKVSRNGRLAQLVQSICLTSRGSAVRIRQRPHETPK